VLDRLEKDYARVEHEWLLSLNGDEHRAADAAAAGDSAQAAAAAGGHGGSIATRRGSTGHATTRAGSPDSPASGDADAVGEGDGGGGTLYHRADQIVADCTVCAVCQEPDAQDANEFVYCDGCGAALHQVRAWCPARGPWRTGTALMSPVFFVPPHAMGGQACYGIITVPERGWLCQGCSSVGEALRCILCPNRGAPGTATGGGGGAVVAHRVLIDSGACGRKDLGRDRRADEAHGQGRVVPRQLRALDPRDGV